MNNSSTNNTIKRDAEEVIKLASYWLQQVSGLSTSTKTKWNNLLKVIFVGELSAEKILLINFQKHKSSDLPSDLEILSKAVATLQLLRKQIEDDSPEDELLLNNKVQSLQQEYELSSSNEYYNNYQDLLKKNDTRFVLTLKSTVWPLVLDHFARWILLLIFGQQGEIWILNILLLFISVPLMYFRDRKVSQANDESIKKYLDDYSKRLYLSPFQWSVLGFLLIISIMVSFVLENSFAMPLVTFLGLGVYYGLYVNSWAESRISESEIKKSINEAMPDPELLTPEKNDELIVEKKVELKSITSKLEAYVLESALFGALAFSGFLQIIAENLISFEDLEQFGNHAFTFFSNVVLFNLAELSTTLQDLSTKQDLFSLISLETLLCSALFLMVIASRLRFTDKSDKIEEALGKASVVNEKEETLLFSDQRNEAQLKKYNSLITGFIMDAEKKLNSITPVMGFMRFFRNAGIFMFFCILISSALFISPFLSLIIGLLVFASYLFFNRQELQASIDKVIYAAQSLFIQRGKVFLWGAVTFYVAGFLFRTIAKVDNTDWLLFTGILMLGLYVFTWLVFIPMHDERFELNRESKKGETWWMTIRFFWGLSALMAIIGFGLKMINYPGAGLMIGIGVLLFSTILIIVGYYMASPKWLGVLVGVFLALLVFGLLFKALHLGGANELILAGLLSVIFATTVINFVFIKNKTAALIRTLGPAILLIGIGFKVLHLPGSGTLPYLAMISVIAVIFSYKTYTVEKPVFHKTYLINATLLVVLGALLIMNPGNSGETAYDNYTLNSNTLKKIREVRQGSSYLRNYFRGDQDMNNPQEFVTQHFKNLEDYLSYIQQYPVTGDETLIAQNYLDGAYFAFRDSNNPEDLKVALALAQKANGMGQRIGFDNDRVYQHIFGDEFKNLAMLEVLLNKKLNQPEKAREAAQRLLSISKNDVLNEELKAYLDK